MSGKDFLRIWLSLPWVMGILSAQQPEGSHLQDEDYLYRGESVAVPLELYEQHADLIMNPLNLNTATPDQLGESELFTAYQIHQLMTYRKRYGRLFSVFELAVLRGFSKDRLRDIAPCLTIEAGLSAPPPKKNQHLIILTTGRILPEAAGYRSNSADGSGPAYRGAPHSAVLRIKSRVGTNLSLGFCYEKDAGETFLAGKKPEHLSGFMQYKGKGLIKQVVLGNFQLNHGLGLVNGSGFMHAAESFRVNRRSLLRIKGYSSKSESGYERGAGVRMDLKLLEILTWFSCQNLDLSTASMFDESTQIDWREHLRYTGLHRTNSEMKGRDLTFRHHGGIQALVSHHQMHAGIAFSAESTGLTKFGIKILGLEGPPIQNQHLSLHGSWLLKDCQIFGEVVLADWKSMAVLSGIRWEAMDFLQGLLLMHHYGRSYLGSRPSAYASGNKVHNESGVALHIHLDPGRRISSDFLGELFQYPGPRYLTQLPSFGQRYSLTFQTSGLPRFRWRIRIVNKTWQSTPDAHTPGLHPVRKDQLTRFDARIMYDQTLQWQSRLLLSCLAQSQHPYPAYAAVQQLSMHSFKLLKSTIQFVVFDVKDWANRIYLYEPGLYYSFSFPSLYGTGFKTTLTLTLKPAHKLSMEAKITCTMYQQRKFLGSGNDLIAGNKKWSVELQARLNL